MGNICDICNNTNDQSNYKQKRVKSRMTVSDLKLRYDIDHKCLGTGAFGKVFKATDKTDPSISIAIKVINKKHMSKEDLEGLENEVAIML